MINADVFLASINEHPSSPQTDGHSLHPALRRAAELGLLIAPTDSRSRFASPAKSRLRDSSRDFDDIPTRAV